MVDAAALPSPATPAPIQQPAEHRQRKDVKERFFGYVMRDGNSSCWHWIGASCNGRYGNFRDESQKMVIVHRFAYRYFVGGIPDRMEVCHACDNTFCVNPAHLFLGTRLENAADMVAKRRQSRGVNHHKTKLSPADVDAIRESAIPQRALARKYNVCQGTVSHIRLGRNWKHA